MLKALALLLFSIFLIHFYILFQTGHLDPCDAAYAKLEFDHVNLYKNKRRELVIDEDEQGLYDSINHRDILQCYKIVLFNGEG